MSLVHGGEKSILDTPIKKLHWKSMVTKIVISNWTEKFQTLKPYFGWDIEISKHRMC